MAPSVPASNNHEHTATVCLPCPKCGEIIRSFAVTKKDDRRDTATIRATCPNCQWADAAETPAHDLGMTSLALPPAPRHAPAPAPAPARARPDLDQPIFAPAQTGNARPVEADLPTASGAVVEADTRMTAEEWANVPLAAAPAPVLGAPWVGVQRPRSPGLQRRSLRDAWLLTVACVVALMGGLLELVLISDRMSVVQIVLVAAVLLPITGWFLVHGLQTVWRATRY